jgi:urease accessory protein
MLLMDASAASGWEARLDLTFRPGPGRTAVSARHFGPLRVQKPFYPEGGVCHVYLLHPPGGVVGGDRLTVRVSAQPGAAALVTTPAAGKFYRSAGPLSVQEQMLAVGDGAALEWLPQEAIVYPGANAESLTRVELAPGARFIGWEVVCFGLPASDAPYDHGMFTQRLEIVRAGVPVLLERCRYEGGSRLLTAPWGLGGRTALGTLVATTLEQDLDRPVREAVERELRPGGDEDFGLTRVDGLTVCRAVAPQAGRVKALLGRAWEIVRPTILGRTPCPPRIWNT